MRVHVILVQNPDNVEVSISLQIEVYPTFVNLPLMRLGQKLVQRKLYHRDSHKAYTDLKWPFMHGLSVQNLKTVSSRNTYLS